MAAYRVTEDILKLIRESKAQGQTSREIAETLLSEHKIKLDQRTISRYAKETHPEPAPKPVKVPKARKPRASTAPLDEIETLEVQAKRIARMLQAKDLTPRNWAALNGELRQTFSAIRRAKLAAREQTMGADEDAKWLLEKLKRFDRMNRNEDDELDDDGELSEATGTAASG